MNTPKERMPRTPPLVGERAGPYDVPTAPADTAQQAIRKKKRFSQRRKDAKRR
jgi:hypothetical protein